MSSSLCYAFLLLTRSEARGAGPGWGHVWAAAPDDLSVAATAAMILLDALIYLAVGYLIDRYFGELCLYVIIVRQFFSNVFNFNKYLLVGRDTWLG